MRTRTTKTGSSGQGAERSGAERVARVITAGLVVVLGAFGGVARAAELHVPGQYPTIQAAIDAAVAGDDVIIADGTYTGVGNKNLDFHGKTITVRSASGDPDRCVIDCEFAGRGFYFHNGETTAAVVAGLTIVNGTPPATSSSGGGGVLASDNSNPTITQCTIRGCFAGSGGAVGCYSSDPVITHCTLTANLAGGGGAIFCYDSMMRLEECTISGNRSYDDGGGLYCHYYSYPTIVNCAFSENMTYGTGGALYIYTSSPTLTNCTLRANTARGGEGGGMTCGYASDPQFTNCILWGDSPQEIDLFSTASPVVAYSDVQGGWAGTGNVNVDPGFAFAGDCHLLPNSPCIDAGTIAPSDGLPGEDLDGNPRALDGDGDSVSLPDMGVYEFNSEAASIALSADAIDFFGLEGGAAPAAQVRSLRNCGGGTLHWEISDVPSWLNVEPASGSSNGEVVEVTVSADTDGLSHGMYTARLQVGDSQAANTPRAVLIRLFVNRTLRVPDEYATIGGGIAAAVDGDAVEIADGVYGGPENRNLDFHGKAISVRSTSGNPEKCIIDCERSGRGFYFHSGEPATAVVSGLTVLNGHVLEDGPGRSSGGGVFCRLSSPTFGHCVIAECSAIFGGGVYVNNSDMVLTGCKLYGNSAYLYGGGIDGSPQLRDCVISGNAASDGAGVFCLSASSDLTNCVISGNTAASGAGGIYCYAAATITNCIVWGNEPEQIYQSWNAPILTYCDVQGGWPGDGNIDAAPAFAFADDLHLMPGSPGIDSGTLDPPGGLSATDLDGNARVRDGDGDGGAVPDLGPYELDGTAPSIALDRTSFDFRASEGGPNPAGQALALRNCGGGTLQWRISGAPAWLTVAPLSGSSNGEISSVALSVDTGTLEHGAYTAVLEVADPQVVNSARSVRVWVIVARTLHVPGEHATIQAAIDAAVAGDVVSVADGVYTGEGNKNLDFHGKPITVRSASGDAEACVIDCEGAGRGVYFHSLEAPSATLLGLTIRNGRATGDLPWTGRGGGVHCYYASPTIAKCFIYGNSADVYGGGLYINISTPTITHCRIAGNSAGVLGGGMLTNLSDTVVCNSEIVANTAPSAGGAYCHAGNPSFTDCTITGNIAANHGGGLYLADGDVTVSNCILRGDAPQEIYVYAGSAVAVHCDIQGGWPGAGNNDADPLFVRVPKDGGDGWGDDPNTPGVDEGANDDFGDLRLRAGSPCIDAADNAAVLADVLDLDFDGDTAEPVPADLAGGARFVDDAATPDCQWAPGTCGEAPIVDMGAYEFVPPCHGDTNCDEIIDFFDINPFVVALLQHDHCDGSGANADVNGDGTVDFYDINPFVILLTQTPLPIECP